MTLAAAIAASPAETVVQRFETELTSNAIITQPPIGRASNARLNLYTLRDEIGQDDAGVAGKGAVHDANANRAASATQPVTMPAAINMIVNASSTGRAKLAP